MKWAVGAILVAGLACSALLCGNLLEKSDRRLSLAAAAEKLGTVREIEPRTVVPCAGIQSAHPLVILALGQSNAGNHGELAPGLEPIDVIAGAHCARTSAPLPGGTGGGGSIWSYVPIAISEFSLPARPIAISVLAVDATAIAEWTSPTSPLAARLRQQLQQLQELGLSPDAIVWQQGEADARMGTTKTQYTAQLRALKQLVRSTGAKAPIFLARSTICRSPANPVVHLAISDVLRDDREFIEGADTDSLTGPANRVDGCHFTAKGQLEAARLWAAAIRASLKL